MNLSSIQLVWLVIACATALAIAVIMGLLRSKKPKHAAEKDDSWERSEERRRRKEALYGSASYVLLFACASVAAALSFHGLVGFGRENLNLSGGWEYLVPFGLDGAAMFCSVLAVREASHGDAAFGSRLLVWLFAGASAWFNWVHAPRGGDHNGAPQFFAGMSLSAAVLFDRALKQTRRAALRELTTLEASGSAESAASLEPASPRGVLPHRRRREVAPVTGEPAGEDEVNAMPRLDSLEKKLKDLEQQFG